MTQRPQLYPEVPLTSHQLRSPPTPTLHPPLPQNYKIIHTTNDPCCYFRCDCPTAIGVDIVSTVATHVPTAFATVVAIAVTNTVASVVVGTIFTNINNAIAVDVETIVSTDIATIITTALGGVVDIGVDIVVLPIVEPRVRFPAGTPSGYLTHC